MPEPKTKLPHILHYQSKKQTHENESNLISILNNQLLILCVETGRGIITAGMFKQVGKRMAQDTGKTQI